MDANGQRFWLLADKLHWQIIGDPAPLVYDPSRRALRLASQRRELSFPDPEILANEALEQLPQTLDDYGNRAYWDPSKKAVMAVSPVAEADEDDFELFRPDPGGGEVSDIAMGKDGVLYLAMGGRIIMHDRRGRWKTPSVIVPEVAGFQAWRLAVDPEGGVWVLDREGPRLAKVSGLPLHQLSHRSFKPGTLRPCEENEDPPRLIVMPEAHWPADERVVAIAESPAGRVAALSWVADEASKVRILSRDRKWSEAVQLLGATHPHSLRWVSEERVAVLLAGTLSEAPVYRLDLEQRHQWPVGDLYPLKKDYRPGPFLHSLNFPAHYPTASGSRALHRLSFPFFAKEGEARQGTILDGGDARMQWHRLYLEAVIPVGCGIKIRLAATEEETASVDIEPQDWYEHRFGLMFEQGARSDIPVGVWESIPSELPQSLLPCEREQGKSGLFSVLIQRSGLKVRTLVGRYLHVHVQLIGNGHASPEIFALRAYGSRFSYINSYLPQLYQESTFLPEADDVGDATGPDFLERFVGNIEGVLTNMEDRIARAYLLSLPQTVPEDSLEWLGSWLGFDLDSAMTRQQQRDFLEAAPDLSRWHGTLRGLKLALEIATAGGVTEGKVVVLEDFRLRRTFATIIGADLDDRADPLTAGGAISGNAFVGDTLFIGDENRQEFLSLFRADLPVDLSGRAEIRAFFDKLAHRVTLLVHDALRPQDLGLITRIAQREMPAHVAFRVLSASQPFLVGMASLVGVDTYLAKRIPPGMARVGESVLGGRDFIQGPAALDKRLGEIGAGLPKPPEKRPIAAARDVSVTFGAPVLLDASQSRASKGRHLIRYEWHFNQGRN